MSVAVEPTAPPRSTAAIRLDWLDPIKALALLGILLNHFVEEFGPGPWFTNPTASWPALSTRVATALPHGSGFLWGAVRMLGWLGDAAPGVFIFASGVGLTLSALRNGMDTKAFYRRRLLRLYPLYIAMHVVILGAALFVPGNTLSFGSPATLLSLAGLRFTRGLFFYISPSWWFVWLILQIYFVYPILFRGLERLGPMRFFAAALAFTVVSRGVGLALPPIRYDWLTGMFFGSRLAEFAAGMVAAWWITNGRELPSVGWAIASYGLGFGAQFFLPTVVFSNLLITLGLTGVFYAIWRTAPAGWMTRLGAASYAIFLLHQPPLKWTAAWFSGGTHVIAAALVLVLSWPAAVWIERAVADIERDGASRLRRFAGPIAWISGLAIPLLLFVVEPQLTPDGRWQRALCWFLAVDAITLIWLLRAPRNAGALSTVLYLFVIPAGSGFLAAILGVLIALASMGGSLVVGVAVTVAVVIAGELAAKRFAPREVGGWGEKPALEIHPTRVFGLIPSTTTHLRYNDYDYIIRTNSFGLASPEIPAARRSANTFRVLTMGDAFTMPEAMSYEQSYPALLQTALARCLAPRPVEVINAGVTGYGPLEEIAQFRELGPLFTPDVVVHEFFVNDWQDITIGAEQRRRGIGLTPSGGSVRGIFRDRSHLLANIRWWYEAGVAAVTGKPSPDQTWKLMLPYYARGQNSLYDTANVARMTRFMTEFRDEAKHVNARLIVFYTPGGVTVLPPDQIAYLPRSGIPLSDPAHYDLQRPYATLEGITDSVGVSMVDLTGPLKSDPRATYYSNAWHWTPEGQRMAAATMLQTLRAQQLIDRDCPL